jgi:hypothetical protein
MEGAVRSGHAAGQAALEQLPVPSTEEMVA